LSQTASRDIRSTLMHKRFVWMIGAMLCLGAVLVTGAEPQHHEPVPAQLVKQPASGFEETFEHAEDSLSRQIDDLMLMRRLDDIAEVDKVRFTGPPPRVIKEP